MISFTVYILCNLVQVLYTSKTWCKKKARHKDTKSSVSHKMMEFFGHFIFVFICKLCKIAIGQIYFGKESRMPWPLTILKIHFKRFVCCAQATDNTAVKGENMIKNDKKIKTTTLKNYKFFNLLHEVYNNVYHEALCRNGMSDNNTCYKYNWR